jgi:excisionase family DNA binding protein
MERETMTVEEAAAYLGIGRSLAYRAVREGTIPSIRVGHRLLAPRGMLQGMLGGEQEDKRERAVRDARIRTPRGGDARGG